MKRKPIIIDTDPGIDDAVAIAVALNSPELDVRLITTVGGNVSVDHTTDNALKLVDFFEKDVPVAAGAAGPLIAEFSDASDIHGASGMEGYEFPAPDGSKLLKKVAIEAMRDAILASDDPVTIVSLAPMTNVALLLKVFPDVRDNIERIVLMGGTCGRGNKGVLSEFNVASDPEAAAIVFGSGVPIAMAGLDVGWAAMLRPEDSERIRDLNETGKMFYAMFGHYRGGSLKTGLKMYDAHAMAYLLDPGMYETQDAYVGIELDGSMTKGCTLVDLRGYLHKPANATVCTGIDAERFRNWLIESIARCK